MQVRYRQGALELSRKPPSKGGGRQVGPSSPFAERSGEELPSIEAERTFSYVSIEAQAATTPAGRIDGRGFLEHEVLL